MGKKPLSASIAAWRPISDRRDRHTVNFAAIKPDVEEALASGYSVKTVWEYLTEKGQISCRYETFTVHVRKYIRGEKAPARATRAPEAPARAGAITQARPLTPDDGKLPKSMFPGMTPEEIDAWAGDILK